MKDKELYAGLIRLHILHHAAHEAIYGAGMMEELARHGYKISPGTLYPLLHRLQKKGYLCCEQREVAGKIRKYYRCTDAGHTALIEAKEKVKELFGELFA
ncbi:PadR family transcriptional regulator [Salinimonas sediminis]|uniref:PadR family transcriptional regulator n=1 Tax=Salinimonas sediminis TaxID=2303538 RepID=A0A346NPE2_9ALTE|nr:PadR family transcriptional regulator [Salinimonas sediminis]AXR07399.1 PadR family transcriptional regulator [Salinimonas sediminis]